LGLGVERVDEKASYSREMKQQRQTGAPGSGIYTGVESRKELEEKNHRLRDKGEAELINERRETGREGLER
jgi:hypothetical protein